MTLAETLRLRVSDTVADWQVDGVEDVDDDVVPDVEMVRVTASVVEGDADCEIELLVVCVTVPDEDVDTDDVAQNEMVGVAELERDELVQPDTEAVWETDEVMLFVRVMVDD